MKLHGDDVTWLGFGYFFGTRWRLKEKGTSISTQFVYKFYVVLLCLSSESAADFAKMPPNTIKKQTLTDSKWFRLDGQQKKATAYK